MNKPEGAKNWIGQNDSLPQAIATKLQNEAAKNETMAGIITLFAGRERTRKDIVIRTLVANLGTEGLPNVRGEVARCLRFMAQLGIGHLNENEKGQVVSLEGIQYTLTAIADAVVRAPKPTTRPMSIDDVGRTVVHGTAKKGLVHSTSAHLTTAKGSPLGATDEAATTLAAPDDKAARRHYTNAKPNVGDARPTVTIKMGGNTLTFEVDVAKATALIKELL